MVERTLECQKQIFIPMLIKNKLISDLDRSLLDHFFWLYKTAEEVKADTRIRSFRIDDGDISISELVSKLLFKLLYLSRLNMSYFINGEHFLLQCCGSGSRIQKMSIWIRILGGKNQRRKITPKKIQLNLSK